MGRVLKIGLSVLLVIALPTLAQNPDVEESHPLLIVEIQTASISSASDEFIELFNNTDQPIDGTNFRLQYRSAGGTDWLNKTVINSTIEPRGRFLIATESLGVPANITTGLGLAAAGGHLRVVQITDAGETDVDQLAWGTAQFALSTPAAAPEAGQSLKRKLNEDGRFIDTDNDSQDFATASVPTPEFSPAVITDPAEEPNENPADQESPDGAADDPVTLENTESVKTAVDSKQIELSELFIDPDQPALDSEDEFVELYNPNDEPVDLEGFIIETGSKYSYNFTLPNITIGAKQYLALYSLDTGLTLSNSGGGARVLSPAGEPIYEAPAYEKAKTDTSWANIGGSWQWTSKPTPNAANEAASKPSTTGSLGSSSTRGRSSSNNTLAAGVASGERNIYEDPPAANESQVDTAVVAGVGALALLYAGNEYRYDLANAIAKIRRYFASRRSGGPSA